MEKDFHPEPLFEGPEELRIAGFDELAEHLGGYPLALLGAEIIAFGDHIHPSLQFLQGVQVELQFQFQELIQQPFHPPRLKHQVHEKALIPFELSAKLQKPREKEPPKTNAGSASALRAPARRSSPSNLLGSS